MVTLIPAPAGARPKPDLARTREIRSISSVDARGPRKRRGAVWWASAAACVVAALAAAWFWRDRVIELAPVPVRYVRELVPVTGGAPAGPESATRPADPPGASPPPRD